MNIGMAGVLTKRIASVSFGGTEAFTYELIRELTSRKHNITLYAAKDAESKAELVGIVDVKTANTESMGEKMSAVYYLKLCERIMKDARRYDVIHNNLYSTYFMLAFASFCPVPVIHTVHSTLYADAAWRRALGEFVLRANDRLVFVSHAAQRIAESPRGSVVVHNGVNVRQYAFSSAPGGYVLWLSRMAPEKGITDAISAVKSHGSKLVINSVCEKEKETRYFTETVIPLVRDNPNIRVLSETSLEAKVRLYQQAKAFLLPVTWEEPFGLVMVEAMACGTPVIAYNRGSIPELVQDGVTGFIIDPDDEERPGKGSGKIKKQGIDGLVEAIARIGEIDRRACRKHVEEHFTVEKMVDRYEQIYQEACSPA